MLYYRSFPHPSSTEWVVFIHGAGGSSAIWYKQVREFREWFNIILLDLRGHGGSAGGSSSGEAYSLEMVCADIIRVLDDARVDRAHFAGVSLGSILMRALLDYHPERVLSMVMTGAITRMNMWARFLLVSGHILKYVVPFRVLYASFAWIVMPGKKAREARRVFRTEAMKVTPAEFRRWLTLTAQVQSELRRWRSDGGSRPILYVMGGHDYMFRPPAEELAHRFDNVRCEIIEASGHVCNVEEPDAFNLLAIGFLQEQSGTPARTA